MYRAIIVMMLLGCSPQDKHKYDGSYDTNYDTYHYENVWISAKGGYRYVTRVLIKDTSIEQYHYYQQHQ